MNYRPLRVVQSTAIKGRRIRPPTSLARAGPGTRHSVQKPRLFLARTGFCTQSHLDRRGPIKARLASSRFVVISSGGCYFSTMRYLGTVGQSGTATDRLIIVTE